MIIDRPKKISARSRLASRVKHRHAGWAPKDVRRRLHPCYRSIDVDRLLRVGTGPSWCRRTGGSTSATRCSSASVGAAPEASGRAGAAFCRRTRSEEHTSELQSLMRISYAVFCLKKKQNKKYI